MTDNIKVTFPVSANNNTLVENDAAIAQGSTTENCNIDRRIVLIDEAYTLLCDNLMSPKFGYLFEDIGGRYCSFDKLPKSVTTAKEFLDDPDMVAAFNENAVTHVVKISNYDTGDSIYINSDGYGTTRVVGRDASCKDK